MNYDKTALPEKVSTIDLSTERTPQELNLDFLFNYQIFPANIMVHRAQWDVEKRKMKVGDTLLQQIFIPPIKKFSQKIIFGVRINKIFDEPTKRGYSYETLVGHVEKGVSIFTVERTDDRTIFKIHTFSTPATWLSKLAGPSFSLPYQACCTRMGLENVRKQIAQSLAELNN